MCVCVCVVIVSLVYCIIVYYFKGIYECVSVFLYCIIALYYYDIIVLHYVKEFERVWI